MNGKIASVLRLLRCSPRSAPVQVSSFRSSVWLRAQRRHLLSLSYFKSKHGKVVTFKASQSFFFYPKLSSHVATLYVAANTVGISTPSGNRQSLRLNSCQSRRGVERKHLLGRGEKPPVPFFVSLLMRENHPVSMILPPLRRLC